MICHPCRLRQHEHCPGGTHCPCQHRTDRRSAEFLEAIEYMEQQMAAPAPFLPLLGITR